MKAKDLFTPQEIEEVKKFLNMFGGKVTKVTDKDGKVVFDSGISFKHD